MTLDEDWQRLHGRNNEVECGAKRESVYTEAGAWGVIHSRKEMGWGKAQDDFFFFAPSASAKTSSGLQFKVATVLGEGRKR